jgi:hypothetical protein
MATDPVTGLPLSSADLTTAELAAALGLDPSQVQGMSLVVLSGATVCCVHFGVCECVRARAPVSVASLVEGPLLDQALLPLAPFPHTTARHCCRLQCRTPVGSLPRILLHPCRH